MSLSSAFKEMTINTTNTSSFAFQFDVEEDNIVVVDSAGKKKKKKKKKKSSVGQSIDMANDDNSSANDNEKIEASTSDTGDIVCASDDTVSASPLCTSAISTSDRHALKEQPPSPPTTATTKRSDAAATKTVTATTTIKALPAAPVVATAAAKAKPSTTPAASAVHNATVQAKSLPKPAVVATAPPRNLKAAAKKQKAKANKPPTSTLATTAPKTPPPSRPAVQLFSSRDLEITEEQRRQRKYGKGVNLVAIGPSPKVRDPKWMKNEESSEENSDNSLHTSPFSFGFGF